MNEKHRVLKAGLVLLGDFFSPDDPMPFGRTGSETTYILKLQDPVRLYVRVVDIAGIIEVTIEKTTMSYWRCPEVFLEPGEALAHIAKLLAGESDGRQAG